MTEHTIVLWSLLLEIAFCSCLLVCFRKSHGIIHFFKFTSYFYVISLDLWCYHLCCPCVSQQHASVIDLLRLWAVGSGQFCSRWMNISFSAFLDCMPPEMCFELSDHSSAPGVWRNISAVCFCCYAISSALKGVQGDLITQYGYQTHGKEQYKGVTEQQHFSSKRTRVQQFL